MTLSQLGTTSGRQPASAPRKSYDGLAGATALRRAGKAAGPDLRGDQAASPLAARRRTDPAKDRAARELTDYYQAILRQPIPARFTRLLDALEAQTPSR